MPVEVESGSRPAAGDEDTAIRRGRIEAEVDHMFADALNHEVMRYLAQAVKKFLAARVPSRAK